MFTKEARRDVPPGSSQEFRGVKRAEKTCKGPILDFFWMALDNSLPTIRFWGGYALGSKIEKWRMAALDVENSVKPNHFAQFGEGRTSASTKTTLFYKP